MLWWCCYSSHPLLLFTAITSVFFFQFIWEMVLFLFSYNREEGMAPKTSKEEKLYSQIAEAEGPQIEKVGSVRLGPF